MSAVFTPTRHKLSVDDYHRLGEVGVLTEDSRVELIDGELIEMAPIGGPHMSAVNRLNTLLVLAVGDLGVVSVQNPVRLPPHSEPQPDFAILKTRAVETEVPGPEDVLLMIEVADTTLAYDRTTKLNLYARYGVTESWIVNLQSKCVEVYREPMADGYSKRIELQLQESASPLALPTIRVAVADIFGYPEGRERTPFSVRIVNGAVGVMGDTMMAATTDQVQLGLNSCRSHFLARAGCHPNNHPC